MPLQPHTLVVTDVVRESPDAVSIVFDVPVPVADRFRYRPGQFLTVKVPSELSSSVARCYSLASSPHDDDPHLRVIVKRTRDGYASNWLCDNVAAGSELEVMPPAGAFGPKDLDQDLLLFAGGSGITPMLSILKSALSQGSGHVALLYANRDESSVIAADELRTLVQSRGDRLHVLHWLESLQGLPDRSALDHFARQFDNREAYICGPAPFMQTIQDALAAAGHEKSKVHIEVFASLSGNPFAAAERKRAAAGEAAAAEATTAEAFAAAASATATTTSTVRAEIDLDGETHSLDWPRGTKLLDFMLGLDIDVPYMCRTGECGTCQAVCTGGSVTMAQNDLLDESDLAEGYVLTCQLLADGDDPVHIEF